MTASLPDRLKADPLRWGLLLAFGAAVGSAAGVVPYKEATDRADASYVVIAMLVSAALLNTAGSAASRRLGRPVEPVDSTSGLAEVDVETADPFHTEQPGTEEPSRQLTVGVGLLLGALAAVANWTASEAISALEVSVAALLIQMQVLFAALLARIWLGERVGPRFAAGAAVTLAGLAVMQGVGGAASGAAMLWGLGAAACFGSMQVVTRRWITRIHPPTVNALRLWIAAVGVSLVPGALAGALELPLAVVGLAAAAAMCGPFLGRLMMMNSAHYIPAATSTLMGLMSPVLALLFGWVLLGELPGGAEVLGGAIVVVGMLVAVSRRSVSVVRRS